MMIYRAGEMSGKHRYAVMCIFTTYILYLNSGFLLDVISGSNLSWFLGRPKHSTNRIS